MEISIIYHFPHESIYAGRTIYNGYKNACSQLGYSFATLSSNDNIVDLVNKTDVTQSILLTSLNSYYLKYLDLDKVKKLKEKGLKVFFNTPFWISPMSNVRINESSSLKDNNNLLEIIHSGIGDVFYNACEIGDERMDGFEKETQYKHHTISLAADDSLIYPEYDEKFKSDISFLGTYLPEKRDFFNQMVYPLRSSYQLKLYGQDWTFSDRMLGWIQKGGQYFNVPYIRSIRKPKLQLDDERKIYNSSLISINVHEEYQKKFGGDCNERTFKIPLAGGFEITDDVNCIRKYFKEGEEIIIAKNKNDWFDKISYYIKNPEKRINIIKAGKTRVLKDHTYKNRVNRIIEIYNSIYD